MQIWHLTANYWGSRHCKTSCPTCIVPSHNCLVWRNAQWRQCKIRLTNQCDETLNTKSKANIQCLLSIGISPEKRFDLPPNSSDMHKVIEHVHASLQIVPGHKGCSKTVRLANSSGAPVLFDSKMMAGNPLWQHGEAKHGQWSNSHPLPSLLTYMCDSLICKYIYIRTLTLKSQNNSIAYRRLNKECLLTTLAQRCICIRLQASTTHHSYLMHNNMIWFTGRRHAATLWQSSILCSDWWYQKTRFLLCQECTARQAAGLVYNIRKTKLQRIIAAQVANMMSCGGHALLIHCDDTDTMPSSASQLFA